jgi:hypothetical protein
MEEAEHFAERITNRGKYVMNLNSYYRCFGTLIVVLSMYSYSEESTIIPEPSKTNSKQQARSVLIAKGNSYLENAVTGIIMDSLLRRSVNGHTIDLKTLKTVTPGKYDAVVIFNAVKSSKLPRSVQMFIKRTPAPGKNPTSNVLICTVRGNRWNPETPPVDGVAGATQTLNINEVAGNVLKLIYNSFISDMPKNDINQ